MIYHGLKKRLVTMFLQQIITLLLNLFPEIEKPCVFFEFSTIELPFKSHELLPVSFIDFFFCHDTQMLLDQNSNVKLFWSYLGLDNQFILSGKACYSEDEEALNVLVGFRGSFLFTESNLYF